MLHQDRYCYAFGEFQLDPFNRRLIRSGSAVHVPPKPFDTLLVLLENHGRIVDKEILLKRIWPDTFVEEATLAQHVHTLRKMLGRGAESDMYIETIAGRGYRFRFPVEVQAIGKAYAKKDGAARSGVEDTKGYVALLSRIFDDPDALTTESSSGTLLTMGMALGLMVVEHTLQENAEQETIAVISVRKATAIERQFYEERRQKGRKQADHGPHGAKNY